MLCSYCCMYNWKASSSKSMECLKGHTKVIIWQSNGACLFKNFEPKSNILRKLLGERGGCNTDHLCHCFRMIVRQRSFSKNCNEHREQVEASIGRRDVQNNPKEAEGEKILVFIFWEIRSYLVCASLLLPHPMMLWLCKTILGLQSASFLIVCKSMLTGRGAQDILLLNIFISTLPIS